MEVFQGESEINCIDVGETNDLRKCFVYLIMLRTGQVKDEKPETFTSSLGISGPDRSLTCTETETPDLN